MSMELMVKAMKVKVGNPLRKLVLMKLADNANDQGECWPSYQHIADQCEIDRSTVRKHIKGLEEQGFLRIENRDGPKGNSSNLYFLNLSPVGRDSTPVGPKSTGVGPKSTPPVGPESTRTSHSSEPVKEPVKEPLRPSASDEDAFELFWSSIKKLGSRKKALELFKAYCKRTKTDPMAFAMILVNDIAARRKVQQFGFDKLHGTTYLSQERWNDQVPTEDAGKPGAFATTFAEKTYGGTANDDFDDCFKDD